MIKRILLALAICFAGTSAYSQGILRPTGRDTERLLNSVHVKDLGIKPGGAAYATQNMAKLQAWFDRNATKRQSALRWGYGDYYFSGVLDTSDESKFKSFHWRGASGPESAAQHQSNNSNYNLTRIICQNIGAGNWWLDIDATTGSPPTALSDSLRPVNIRFENLTFMVPTGHQGNMFNIGNWDFDPDTGAGLGSIMRGLYIDGCYFYHEDHDANQGWITDEGVNGWVLDSYRPWAIRCTNIYDLHVTNSGGRGWWTGLWANHPDQPNVEGWRCISTNRPFMFVANPDSPSWDYTDWADNGVPGQITELYSEASPMHGPVIASGELSGFRGESGYGENYYQLELADSMAWSISGPSKTIPNVTAIAQDAGGIRNLITHGSAHGLEVGDMVRIGSLGTQIVYSVPSATTWLNGNDNMADFTGSETATHAACATVDFTGIPAGKTLSDYFEPYTSLWINPTQTYNDAKRVLIIRVDDANSKLWYANADGFSHFAETVSGDETTARAGWGVPLTIIGSRVSATGLSPGINQRDNASYAGKEFPAMQVVLNKNSIDVGGFSAAGTSGDHYDKAWWPTLIAHTAGHARSMAAQLNWASGDQIPQNPLVRSLGDQESNGNVRAPYLHNRLPIGEYDLIAAPGMGQQNSGDGDDASRSLQFHYLTPPERPSGFSSVEPPQVACYRLQGAPSGWKIPHYVPGEAKWTARINLDDTQAALTGNNLTIWDGATSHSVSLDALDAGWHLVSGTVPSNATGIQLSAGTSGSKRDYFVQWVGVNYDTKPLAVPIASGLLATSPLDNQRAVTQGRTTIGDGGSGTYYFDADSTATPDGGFVLNGRGGSTLTATDGTGRWILENQDVANVLLFGAVRSFATDSTAAFEAARDATKDTTGEVYAPGGDYTVSYQLYTSSGARTKLRGDYGATTLRAPSDGEFAIYLPNNIFTDPQFAPLIEGITFDGSDGTTARKRCGICAPRRVFLRDVEFTECLIGVVNTDNYYAQWENLNVRSCDVGLLFGNYDTSNKTITQLLDGDDNYVSVVLPTFANNSSGHSGNKLISALRISGCRLGFAITGESGISPRILCHKPTIESCGVGVYCRRGQVRLENPWLEAHRTEANSSFNGVAFTADRCFTATSTGESNNDGYYGGIIEIDGGRIGKGHSESGGRVVIHDGDIIEALTSDVGGSIDIRSGATDNISLPYVIDRPRPLFGRCVASFVKPKTIRVADHEPIGGRVLISEDFSGSALASAITKNSGALTFGHSGGAFPEGRCANLSSGTAFGWNLNGVTYTSGKYYALYMHVYTPEATTWTFANGSGVWTTGYPDVPANQWTAMVNIVRAGTASGTFRIKLSTVTGTQQIKYGALSLLEFDTKDDAARFAAEPYFYLESDQRSFATKNSEVITAATADLSVYGPSELDSSSNAIDADLADPPADGYRKVIRMTDATNSSTVTVASHETSSPEVFTFDAVGEYLILEGVGGEWVTVKATATP